MTTYAGTLTPTEQRERHLRRHAFVAANLGWLLDGFENYTVVLVATPVALELVGPHASPLYASGILAATLAAWAVGGLVWGVVADYIGRRRALMFSILWYAVFAGLSALSPNYTIFILLRFASGLGLGAEWATGNTLLAEHLKPRTRGRGLGFLAGSFGVGFLIATGIWLVINTGPGSWRWMFVIGILPAVLAWYVRTKVEEPETWVRARTDRMNARARARRGVELDERDVALTTLTFLRPFQDPRLRGLTIKLLLMALSCLVAWWTISTRVLALAGVVGAHAHHPQIAQYVSMVALYYNIGGILGYYAMGFAADAWGRKPTIFTYFVASLVTTYVLFLGVHTTGLLMLMAGVNGFFSLGLMGWMGIYPPECYPTYIRATAITTIFNLSRFIVAAMIMLSGYLIVAFGSVSTMAVTLGSIYLIGIVLALVAGPETKGQPLPE